MTISERLFEIMKEKSISMPELARMTGISRHTIFDWQRRGTNPGADKIMVICEALQITPEYLLNGSEGEKLAPEEKEMGDIDTQIKEKYMEMSSEQKKRLLAYMSMLQNMKKK